MHISSKIGLFLAACAALPAMPAQRRAVFGSAPSAATSLPVGESCSVILEIFTALFAEMKVPNIISAPSKNLA